MGIQYASSTGDKSYIIVGAGVFGASTALHLIRAKPRAKVMLLDRDAYTAPTRVAASWDWNKVVRADYADIDYMRLALEAKERWANDAIWKPFYHESGAYWVSTTDFSQRVQQNFKKLGVDSGLLGLPVDEARKAYGAIFEDGDYTGVKEVFINKLSGWAEAKEALRCTIEEAVRLGAEYVEADVSKLEFDEQGTTTGIVTSTGEVLRSDCVILSTGAYTAKLLADSAPSRPELHAGDRFVAVGVTEGFTPVSGENAAQLYGGPVGIAALPPERGIPNSFKRSLVLWVLQELMWYNRSEQRQRPSLKRQDTQVLGADLFHKHAATPQREFYIQPSRGARLCPIRGPSHPQRRCGLCRKNHLRKTQRGFQYGEVPYLLVGTSPDPLGGTQHFSRETHSCAGMPSRPAKTSSFPHTPRVRTSTLRRLVHSTAGSSCRCSGSMSCSCSKGLLTSIGRRNGRGIRHCPLLLLMAGQERS